MLKIHQNRKQKKYEKTSSCQESSDLRHKNASESSDLKQEKINNLFLNKVLRRNAKRHSSKC
jgi:hypothetical protein